MVVRFGPGGTDGLGYEKGLEKIKELNLDALEVEFTYGVRMKNEEAQNLGGLAKKLGINLSIHAPYYVNLASLEKPKIHASITRILQSCERGHHMEAKYVVFHAGFYQKQEKEKVYQMIKEQVLSIQDKIKEKGWNIKIAPEITGKGSQFGDMDELLRLRKETGCHLTVDFAHLKARNNGVINYGEIVKKLKGLGHIHSHFSGIEWTEKGERKHLITEDKEIKELLKAIIDSKIEITIINESPDPITDASRMKETYQRLVS